jgi:N,N-dimethylformamidase
MMTAADGYLGAGGRLMYLGGNGMYWVTGIDPKRPHIIEVRRSVAGHQPEEGAPGEGHLSTTGEAGALWRGRGQAPNRIAGIGFTAQGWAGRAPGYIRQAGSFDPRAAFIFEGVGPDEIIGDFGLVLGGAAGDELDRIDFDLGTPPHTLVLASSRGHNQSITPVLEDVPEISASIFAANNPNVRADMVFFETPNGGAVFSVGSICWFGSLSHNHYNNNVSRITENVVRRFMS